jgi:molybdenum cofactor cytidylyltransferase
MQPLHGKPLLLHAVDAAIDSKLDRILVVGPAAHPAIEAVLPAADERVDYLSNPDPQRGQMSSLKLALDSSAADAVVVMLADMPCVTAALLDELIASFRSDGRSAIPTCEGKWRHPRLLASSLFAGLLELRDDERGQELLGEHADRISEVEFSDPSQFLDVDRPEDLERVKAILAQDP